MTKWHAKEAIMAQNLNYDKHCCQFLNCRHTLQQSRGTCRGLWPSVLNHPAWLSIKNDICHPLRIACVAGASTCLLYQSSAYSIKQFLPDPQYGDSTDYAKYEISKIAFAKQFYVQQMADKGADITANDTDNQVHTAPFALTTHNAVGDVVCRGWVSSCHPVCTASSAREGACLNVFAYPATMLSLNKR